jgi:hypothetical protein
LPQSVISERITITPDLLAKQGVPGQNKENQNYDKNTRNACGDSFHLPRHSSFMIMHTFADWGNTGQNMAESLGITTISTTKAHGQNLDKGKGVGRNP